MEVAVEVAREAAGKETKPANVKAPVGGKTPVRARRDETGVCAFG